MHGNILLDPTLTHAFRLDRRGPALVAALSAALVFLALAAARFGPGFGNSSFDPLWLGLCCLVLGTVGAVALCCWAWPPVVLLVGPDGLEMPITWRGPVPWRDIHRILIVTDRRLLSRNSTLRIDLSPGLLPPFRLPGFDRLELWYLRRTGLRMPIHKLDASPEHVLASVERFRPVMRRGA